MSSLRCAVLTLGVVVIVVTMSMIGFSAQAIDSVEDWRQSKIVFDSERDGDAEIYVMNPDGSNQQRLTNRKGLDLYPSWSPDGKRIAFGSTRDGNMAIFAMDPDGSNVTRLTKSAYEFSVWSPDWSPDGKRILFQSPRDGNVEDIFVMDADGSNVQRLTNTPGSGKFSSDQAWSPDGNWIAFNSNRSGKQEIYVMSVDGSNVKRLTDTPGTAANRKSFKPVWSPDGKRFAFNSTRDRSSDNPAEVVEIYTMDTDGSNVRRLTHTTDEGYPSFDAKWSPDGKKIAFISPLPGAQWSESREIYVRDADGSNVQRLTFNEAYDRHHDW